MTATQPQLAIAPTEPTEPTPTAAEAILARRKSLRESAIFARIWRLAIVLREADNQLVSVMNELKKTSVATIFTAAGLPPAQDGEPFGNAALSEVLENLRDLSEAMGDPVLYLTAEVAVLGAPEAVLCPAA